MSTNYRENTMFLRQRLESLLELHFLSNKMTQYVLLMFFFFSSII